MASGHARESDEEEELFHCTDATLPRPANDASEFQCADAESIGVLPCTWVDFRLPVTCLLIVDSLPPSAETTLRISMSSAF